MAYVPTIKTATKSARKLKAGLFGPPGSGKTRSALEIASGLILPGQKIYLVDSEGETASLYSDYVPFQSVPLPRPERTLPNYIDTYNYLAALPDCGVIISDSMTHAWDWLLTHVDFLTNGKYRGNSHRAWAEGTPMQDKLVECIIDCPVHFIGTMRSKIEWSIDRDNKGNTKVQKVGTTVKQGKDIEYEFDLLIDISAEHVGTVSKDRTGFLQDAIIEKPGYDLGVRLREWLSSAPERPKLAASAAGQGSPTSNGNDSKGNGVVKDGAYLLDWIKKVQGKDGINLVERCGEIGSAEAFGDDIATWGVPEVAQVVPLLQDHLKWAKAAADEAALAK